jgi:sulfate/thiosulfate transport system substrate-binding protein
MSTFSRAGRLAVVASAAVAIGLSACSSSGGGSSKSIAIVAFSVPKPAYDALETAFQKTSAGKGVKFSQSYGPSGTQSKAVASGEAADYVALSLEPDMTKLVPKFVDPGWKTGTTKGIVSESVVVIAVRKGNPKHITGWNDLIKPGVKIVTPDPASSGSAKWNILAAYTHVLADGGTASQAKSYLTSFFGHVVSKPASGSDATTTFRKGTGDVLISYENEAISSRQKGAALDYVVPDESILIQNPGAVTKKASPVAKDFLNYVESDAGQQVFVSKGFRPVSTSVHVGTVKGANNPAAPFPTVKKLTTIDQLGGWAKVNKEFFADTNGIVTLIEKGAA